jgi:Neutral/alkaline non-lysosomal ceramidase, N-terminal
MSGFRAAAGEIEITPSSGGWMTGFGARFGPAVGVLDPIMARACMLQNDDTTLIFVSCDVLGFGYETILEIRKRVAEKIGIASENIFIGCTHTHSGPASLPMRGMMGKIDADWPGVTTTRIIDLVISLQNKCVPAKLAHASALVEGLGYNRQDNDHEFDQELNVVAIDSLDGEAIAVIVCYPLHPVVLNNKNMLFSADFPGAVIHQLSARRGGIGLYLQGACGDIDPVVYRDRGWGKGTPEDMENVGTVLASKAVEIIANAEWSEDVMLSASAVLLELPLEPPPTLDAVEQVIAENTVSGDEHRKQNFAETIRITHLQWARELKAALLADEAPRTLPVEMIIAGINDICFVGIPLEPYSAIGLDIKRKLKPVNAVVAGYTNGLYGYCAAIWAFDQAKYAQEEASKWYGSLLTPLARGCDLLIIDAAVTSSQNLQRREDIKE